MGLKKQIEVTFSEREVVEIAKTDFLNTKFHIEVIDYHIVAMMEKGLILPEALDEFRSSLRTINR